MGRHGVTQFCHLFVGKRCFPVGDLRHVCVVHFAVFVTEQIEAEGLHDVACVFSAFPDLLAVQVESALPAFVVCVVSEHDAVPFPVLDVAGIGSQ